VAIEESAPVRVSFTGDSSLRLVAAPLGTTALCLFRNWRLARCGDALSASPEQPLVVFAALSLAL